MRVSFNAVNNTFLRGKMLFYSKSNSYKETYSNKNQYELIISIALFPFNAIFLRTFLNFAVQVE